MSRNLLQLCRKGAWMKFTSLLGFFWVMAFGCVLAPPPAVAADDGWIPLFNGKNLDGWYTYLLATGKNNDPLGVFKIEDGMIHILGIPETGETSRQIDGFLISNQEYSNVRIHAEYKWGTRRFPAGSEDKRNSGLFYLYAAGTDNDPRAIQFQIEESDTGDVELIGGHMAVTTQVVSPPFPLYSEDDYGPSYHQTIGGPQESNNLRVIKNADFEDRTGWNSIDVILDGTESTHVVNGRVVNHIWDIRQQDPKHPSQMIALTTGRIVLEVEGAEIWFRNIKIKPLK